VKRKAVIISNPGESGDESYCAGVLKDVVNYKSFLLSAIGGVWFDSEIDLLPRPSASDVRKKLNTLSSYDYSLIIFTGHGYHCTIRDSSILALSDKDEIDSDELIGASSKQTIILDCCRESYPTTRTMIMDAMKVAKSMPLLSPEDCRKFYNGRIHDCSVGVTVMYSCDVDELSGDDSRRGGYYSSSLIEVSEEWARRNGTDTSKYADILSVAQAHSSALPIVQTLARPREQNPQIKKTRTGPYFPFCIVA
jgi:hypothetical protein